VLTELVVASVDSHSQEAALIIHATHINSIMASERYKRNGSNSSSNQLNDKHDHAQSVGKRLVQINI
jgi:hypothetical protein